jgi:Protein of unknown function (DUF2726)
MPTMALVGGLTLAVLVLGWLWLRGRRTADASFSDFNLDNWQPRTIRPLTQVELAMLGKIKMAVPECMVLPQVSLSRFLKVKSSLPYGPWFRHVGRRCVDFLICSPKGDVLGVVELIDSKKANAAPSHGSQAKERTLTLAAIPVWHVDPESTDGLHQLHDYIRAELGESVVHSIHGLEWPPTEASPRGAGIEAVELDDDRWNQPWPSEETRPSAYLDLLDSSQTDEKKPH